MRLVAASIVLLLAACASANAARCPESGAAPEAVSVREGVTGHALCTGEGVLAGVELEAGDATVRTGDDAARLSGQLLGRSIGELVAIDPVGLAGAGRTRRRAFYERGMLHTTVIHDEERGDYVRVAAFFAYRPVTDRFTECSSVPLDAGGNAIRMLVGTKGTVYTADQTAVCDGQTEQTVMAAGPTDRSYPAPEDL